MEQLMPKWDWRPKETPISPSLTLFFSFSVGLLHRQEEAYALGLLLDATILCARTRGLYCLLLQLTG
jgi:hypothetical protein